MNADIIKKTRDVAEKLDLNLEIIFDNMGILNTKGQGCVVNFDDATETIVYVRVTDSPTRMLVGPLEFGVKSYDEIQKLTIQATKNMFSVIDDMKQYCGDKADKMKEFVQTTPASTTYHSTPSAEDVTNRAGTKPTIYSTNEYNSAGENRASRASKTPKRITVTVDANGKVNGADKIPHIDRPASTQQHISNDTIM